MNWPFVIRCVFAAFAVFRLARMITLEDGPFGIFKELRGSLGKRAADKEREDLVWWMAELFNCPHCVGVWVTFLVSLLVILPTAVGDIFLTIFAIAGAQSFLQGRSDE